jgi:3-hydroxyisobutyrate dehydrogenase-like beta-hydroxyacid dehydrogenase
MGTAIVGRLLDAGRPVTVWNRTAAKAAPLAARGAVIAGSMQELAESDVVFVMVSASADLEQVTMAEGGLLRLRRRPRVIVDCSTVSESTSARVRAAAADAGIAFLAAPVCGNPHVVADGQASFIVSGPEQTYQALRPDLERIARNVVYVGGQEQARLVKLAHNLFLGMMLQSLVEVITLAEKGGTPRAAFLEFFNGSALTSTWVQRRSEELVSGEIDLTFTTELLRKDFDLGLAAARQLEVPMVVAANTHQIIQTAIAAGLREEDFLRLYDHQARAAALPGG